MYLPRHERYFRDTASILERLFYFMQTGPDFRRRHTLSAGAGRTHVSLSPLDDLNVFALAWAYDSSHIEHRNAPRWYTTHVVGHCEVGQRPGQQTTKK